MGIADFFKGELIDVIEWTDDSRDTLSFRCPDDDKAIKNGAQLIVRESQVAQLVYLGEFGDTFLPGKHTLATDNIPILTRLASWKYGFNSPFKADDTAFLSGHIVEHYQVVLTEASNQSQQQMHQALEQLCAAQIPGDTHRNLMIHPAFSDQTFKHILVPIWLLTYVFRSQSYQVLVNGSTGRIAGKYPLSAWKIFFVALLVLIGVVLVIFADQG